MGCFNNGKDNNCWLWILIIAAILFFCFCCND